MAITQRQPSEVIHHSDRGCQYTSYAFGKRCREAGVMPSMGSVGDAYDNAMAESFFATLERELLNRRRFKSQAEAKMAVFEWIEGWYNPHRRHSSLGYRSPVNYERAHQRSVDAEELLPPAAADCASGVNDEEMNQKLRRKISTIAHVTIDSYLAIVAIAALSFWVGTMLWRRAPARSTILISLLAPVGWLLGLLFAAYTPPLALSALSVVYLFSALAPLLGIALAYALPSNQHLERP